MQKKIAIIGGGAAGFFASFSVKKHHPNAEVVIFEKTARLLSKVKVSGGGRCNVTNGCRDIPELIKAYPRGSRLLRNLFYQFSTGDTWDWFEERGVKLVLQEDQCVFPASQDSQTIIDCFLEETRINEIQIRTKTGVDSIDRNEDDSFCINKNHQEKFSHIIIATGGFPKARNYEWIKNLGEKIELPRPSLFTFNMPNESIKELMGIVVENALTKVEGGKWLGDGPLLITHWGMSGPAILKLSAYAARELADKEYQFTTRINWVNIPDFELVKQQLYYTQQQHPNKKIDNQKSFPLSSRLWTFLLKRAEISPERAWKELGSKSINKLTEILTNDGYQVSGKTTFKEEFVTAGGVSLKNIKPKTLESKNNSNIYFAGEVLDVDGITGGYNFQAAWTTGFVAGKLG
ncbi:MAG: NAD(P)/FAD-dependent oxidoreductase [Flavobacteriales bacterium]|jgi:predicted Rossmann fold flavoprotein|nr:NAD(P)/FAD-dependent oxidoreductase [Flavobacteriales bacterium]